LDSGGEGVNPSWRIAHAPNTASNTRMPIVETRNLRKCYGAREVLHGIELRVPRGALFGFLGPNGAGKTTTIRILLGLLRRDAGDALLFGRDSWRAGARLRRDVGYLPGDIRWWDRLSGRATLRFLGAARGVQCDDAIERLSNVLQLNLDQRVRSYSRGMKQKLGLMQALMHRPQLLVLDEPTTGLDPLMQRAVLDELRDLADAGHTVLFSSHTLSEVEELCDHVAILRDGNIIEQTTMDALRSRALRSVEVRFESSPPNHEQLPADFRVEHVDGELLRGHWTGQPGDLVQWLATQRVADVIIAPPDLDDLFRAYYTKTEAKSAS
jgi:ABC-2 type transport system ATP-binding protein